MDTVLVSPYGLVVSALSDGGVAKFCSISPPRGPTELRAEFDGRVPSAKLAPNDSVQFFLYPSITGRYVRRDGSEGNRIRDTRTFSSVGSYSLSVTVRPTLGVMHGWCPARVQSLSVQSNEIRLSMRPLNRLEARVTDALWRCRAVGDEYLPGGSRILKKGTIAEDNRNIETLRAVKARVPSSPLIPYVDYAIARMLLDGGIDYPLEHQEDLRQAVLILENLRQQQPRFRPDDVSYHLSMALLRGDIWGLRFGDRARARDVMAELMKKRPALWSNPDFALLASTASQTDDDIEIRVRPDKSEYVVGEPMLFRVVLANISPRIVRVPGHSLWTPWSSDFAGYLEIERPDGKRELRSSHGQNYASDAYPGIPLAPGDSLVSIWNAAAIRVPIEKWSYRTSRPITRAFAGVGLYRVRVGCAPKERWWRVWGAGRLTLSKPVEIIIRPPSEAEQRIIATLQEGKVDNPFVFIRDDKAAIKLAHELASEPRSALAYHARRGIAWVYAAIGPKQDLPRALSMLDSLEGDCNGIRREWVQMERLSVLGRLWVDGIFDETRREEARQLIVRMTESNPTLWANGEFCFHAFHALYGQPGGRWKSCWETTIHRDGVGRPTVHELDPNH